MKVLQVFSLAAAICSLLVAGQDPDDMLMVIGGHGDTGDFSTVELVSLDPVNNPVPECLTDLSEIPVSSGIAAASVGMSADGYPLLCGGKQEGGFSSSCLVYFPSNDSWSERGSMEEQKGYSAYGTSLEYGFTMAGGNSENEKLDDVESTFDGITFSSLTPLTDGIEQACLAFIDENRFILAGGLTADGPSSSVFLYNLLDGTSTRLRDMTFPTYGHSCGVVLSQDKFVVTGGFELPPFGTTQIYYIEDDSWLLGNPFFDIVGGASVPYGDSFLIVGGYSYEVDTDFVDLVHYYDPEFGSIIPLDGRLKNKKEDAAALLVKRSSFPECD